MKAFRYSCDCGCLAVGSPDCMTLVQNSEGDGTYTVRIMDRAEFSEVEGLYIFKTVTQGRAVTIFDYDCTGAEPLCTLSGRFAVYRRIEGGDMAVVVWEDWTGKEGA